MQGNLSDNISLYKKLMWTGTGIGIGGLAMTGAGIGMLFSSDPITDYKENVSGPDRYRENIIHSLGWAFVGVGAALTITGAALAGTFGYKYTHYSENAEMMVSFNPTGASFLVAF